MKNYYQILNVKPTATEAEIKRNYRSLAKKYHPDMNHDDKLAADKFSDVNEAYDTLIDPQLRAKYDSAFKKEAERAAAKASTAKSSRVQTGMRQSASSAHAQPASGSAASARAKATAQSTASANGTAFHSPNLQAHIQAQVQAQVKAYLTTVRNQAFTTGREQGAIEARAAAGKEVGKLRAEVSKLASACEEKEDAIAELKRAKRELESELLSRTRALEQEQLRAEDLESQIQSLRKTIGKTTDSRRLASENERLRAMLDVAQDRMRQLHEDRTRSELTAITERNALQDERDKYEGRITDLVHKVNVLTRELEEAHEENSRLQRITQDNKHNFDTEFVFSDWTKKVKADRRLAKPTLYGTLGVLIWATELEIDTAFTRLVKYYSAKAGGKVAEKHGYTEKLEKIRHAYEVLSNPEKRREYNAFIGITEERIESERKLIRENEEFVQEYRDMLENKEFWVRYDALVSAALSGDADAQNALGKQYYDGTSLERDYFQAVFWFKEAAKQKHPAALYNLGECYIKGNGVEKGESVGLAYIRQANKLGYVPPEQQS